MFGLVGDWVCLLVLVCVLDVSLYSSVYFGISILWRFSDCSCYCLVLLCLLNYYFYCVEVGVSFASGVCGACLGLVGACDLFVGCSGVDR